MAVNALDATKGLSELNSPLIGTGTGTVTPTQRKAAVKLNLGLTTNDGVTPIWKQPAPIALNATGAVTTAMILNGIITSTTAAAVVGTLPLGTALETAWIALFPGLAADDALEFSVVATGANSFTLALAAGITDGGNALTAVATATSARFLIRRTAANVFVIYKIA